MKAEFIGRKSDGDKIKELEEELMGIEQMTLSKGWVAELREKRSACMVKLWKKIQIDEQKWRQMSRQISDSERVGLEAIFTEDGVMRALRDCDGNRAPGPDGFTLNFVKQNWEWIKNDFMDFLNVFHEDGSLSGRSILDVLCVQWGLSKLTMPFCYANGLMKCGGCAWGGGVLVYALRRRFKTGLWDGTPYVLLRREKEFGVSYSLQWYGRYENVEMRWYSTVLSQIWGRQFLLSWDGLEIKYVPRDMNSLADYLVKNGSHGYGDRLEWGDLG
ncbi:hypothetical protein Dsin_032016 [Dipteronia sinensis]|uniref:Uncharacterized protein n=1 Tax=Dipteronia sinensis TaxID=43782 RepID=A0AAE0DTX1_9ROSI|nr:hypothetical protein Dsin_032016 [Dipteronia sinensis]